MAEKRRPTQHQSKKPSKQKEQPHNLENRNTASNITVADEEIETDAVSRPQPQLLPHEQNAIYSGARPSSRQETDFNRLSISGARPSSSQTTDFNRLSISGAQSTRHTPDDGNGYANILLQIMEHPILLEESITRNAPILLGKSITRYARSDLHTGAVNCLKHPNHDEFIPIHELTMDHFPSPFRKPCWPEFIQLKATDVVRLSLTHTSNRPEALRLGDTKPVRYGTGTAFVCDMDKAELYSCSAVAGVSVLFRVLTAAHVVFDDEEAKSMTVEFFYDSADLSTVVKGWGVRVYQLDVDNRRSVIECRTHDLSLFQRLRDARDKRNEIMEKEIVPEGGTAKMVVLISHPHGLCKQVSFGTLKDKTIVGDVKVTKEGMALIGCFLTYDTPTCAGSGGGPVNVLGGSTANYAFAPHYATNGTDENISGLGWTRAGTE